MAGCGQPYYSGITLRLALASVIHPSPLLWDNMYIRAGNSRGIPKVERVRDTIMRLATRGQGGPNHRPRRILRRTVCETGYSGRCPTPIRSARRGCALAFAQIAHQLRPLGGPHSHRITRPPLLHSRNPCQPALALANLSNQAGLTRGLDTNPP